MAGEGDARSSSRQSQRSGLLREDLLVQPDRSSDRNDHPHPPQATAVGGAATAYIQQTNRKIMGSGEGGAEWEWELGGPADLSPIPGWNRRPDRPAGR